MNQKVIQIIIISISIFCYKSFAQIGIGTTNPNPSAILEVQSTEKGFLLPRLSYSQRVSIPSPISQGLMIYNTDEKCINVFNDNNWQNLCTGQVSTTPPNAPNANDIIDLVCSQIQFTQNTGTVNLPINATVTIPYNVANNDVSYLGGQEILPEVTSTASSNYKLTLQSGNTGNTGQSTLIYKLTGTATTAGTVTFIIDFNGNPVGGCGVNLTINN
jgi:hypothetical protein